MFGIPAFGVTPFAAQATTIYALSIDEAITFADSSTQSSAFFQTQAENIGISDVENDVGGNFFGSLTESITLEDSSTQQSTFLQTISEDFSSADVITIAAQFSVSVSEDSTLDDVRTSFFAAIMDLPAQGITLADSNTQQSAFVQSIAENINPADVLAIQVAFLNAIAENVNMADNTVVSGWMKIIDDQTANWAVISNTESAGWAVVDTTETAGWTVVNNLQ